MVDGTLSGSGATFDIPLDVTSTQWPIAATLLILNVNDAEGSLTQSGPSTSATPPAS